jgi:hypothetical protein
VIVPGLCAGDLTVPAEKLGVPVVRGPEDMKDLPDFLGCGGVPPDLSRYDTRIFAGVMDAPWLTVEGILERAARYGADGADFTSGSAARSHLSSTPPGPAQTPLPASTRTTQSQTDATVPVAKPR